jgi:hypothetical protein
MRFKRFRSDGRLWSLIWFVLFAIPWFIPQSDRIRGEYLPITLFLELFTEAGRIHYAFSKIFAFTAAFGILAFIPSWIVQCIVVMIRDTIDERGRNQERGKQSDPH